MTSTAADSAIDISSRALILIGAEPITSFTDGTTESLVAGSLYEDICRSALSNTRWRFATDQAVLNRLTDAPTGRYDFAYQLPADTLLVHAVTVNDGQINTGEKISAEVIRLLNLQKEAMMKQLIKFPDLYYAKSHFPLDISQRAINHLWRVCESYELWCNETKNTKLIKLNIIE